MPLIRMFCVECDFCGHNEKFMMDGSKHKNLDKWFEVIGAADPIDANGQKSSKWYDSPECAMKGIQKHIESRKSEQQLAGVIGG